MTAQGPDRSDAYSATGPTDPFEARLAGRLASHADNGVRPIDAAGIATAAAAAGGGASRRSRGGAGAALGRLGWLLAGAAIAAGAIGGTMWAGSHGLLGTPVQSSEPSLVAVGPSAGPSIEIPTAAPSIAIPTAAPIPTAPPIPACNVADLSAQVTSWSGAAGNRVAAVTLTNGGATACQIQSLERPQLVDANDAVLIDGDAPSHPSSVTLGPGATVSTEVDDANYCGSTNPKAPVTVAYVFSGGQQLVAAPWKPTDAFGVPDCLGSGQPGLITMHPWAP